MMSPSGSEHGWVVMNVAAPMATFVKQRQLGYVFGAESGFIIQRNPDSVRAPDVAFVLRDRVAGELPKEFFDGPPDLAVEVLSPSDTASAVHEKAEDWLGAKCQEVWLIDPQRKTASKCTWSVNAIVREPVEHLSTELLPGFELGLGAYVKALSYAAGVEPLVIGKPSEAFFGEALADLGLPAADVGMVGDDLESDIGGAQAAGMAGILVRTGKFDAKVVAASAIEPALVVDDIAALARRLAAT